MRLTRLSFCRVTHEGKFVCVCVGGGEEERVWGVKHRFWNIPDIKKH